MPRGRGGSTSRTRTSLASELSPSTSSGTTPTPQPRRTIDTMASWPATSAYTLGRARHNPARGSHVAAVLLGALLFSCSLLSRDFYRELEADDPADSEFGTLEIDFSSIFGVPASADASARDLLPPVDMRISRCDITGTLEGGADGFTASVGPGEQFSRSGLIPGLWTIVVDAVNEEGVTIGRGETTVQIAAGAPTEAHITISPLPGVGILDLMVRWGKKDFQTSRVEGDLTPAITEDGSLPFVMNVEGDYRISTYLNTAVPAVYYTLDIRLIGNGAVVWGITESVRILAGETTGGSWTYPPP